MKKINLIVVGLVSISVLAGCSTSKIERSQQDIKQEKVEKAKKEIAKENKRKKASSTELILHSSNECTEAETSQETNSNESVQTESTQTESTQENNSTVTKTESHQYGNCCTCESCVSETKRLQDEYKNKQGNNETNTNDTTIPQQGYPISYAPAWWRECNAKGHKVIQGLNTQTGNYCWRCIDCNKEVAYDKCTEHNVPATPEHMQLHLN